MLFGGLVYWFWCINVYFSSFFLVAFEQKMQKEKNKKNKEVEANEETVNKSVFIHYRT